MIGGVRLRPSAIEVQEKGRKPQDGRQRGVDPTALSCTDC